MRESRSCRDGVVPTGEAPTLESVISAYGEAIATSEEDPVQGYEATKSKASKQLRRLLTSEESINEVALQVEQQRRFVSAKGLSR